MSSKEWVKSSACNADGCLEVAPTTVGGEPYIAIRDSEDPSLEVLTSVPDFAKFLAGAKAGDFDDLLGAGMLASAGGFRDVA